MHIHNAHKKCNCTMHQLVQYTMFSTHLRVAADGGAALPERSGSSTKGRTPNILYFVTKLSIVILLS